MLKKFSVENFKGFKDRITLDIGTQSNYGLLPGSPIGKYTLREETAPAGYLVAEDVLFTVKDTGVEQKVEMKDAPKKQPETTPTTEKPTTPDNPTNPSTPTTSKETPKETPTTPKTGDDRNPLIWLLLLALGGGLAGAAWYLRKKDEKDQNQE